MTDEQERTQKSTAREVFAGLTPQLRTVREFEDLRPRDASMLVKGMQSTVPILLVGSMAMAMNLTGPVPRADARGLDLPKNQNTRLKTAAMAAVAVSSARTVTVPTSYTVVSADTVSSIAARFGLSTASVLALNGLGWKSLIFPGQVLILKKGTPAPAAPVAPAPSGATTYTIVRGDTISAIAARFGATTSSVLTANKLSRASIIYPGQRIVIPSLGTPVATPPPAPVVAPPAGQTPPVVTTPAPPAPAPAVTGSYVIVAADTVTRIANKFGVSVQSVLDANGLTRTSIIYVGRVLIIPGVTTAATGTGTVTLLSGEMVANAQTIVSVGRELGVNDYGIIIALATAMQESTMRNLNYGHLDSVGLFQQRPSAGWGTVAQLTDTSHAARLFYGGPSNPNKGKTRGLLDIVGWQSMTVTQAAQKVQISAYPDAYAKWESSARFWLSEIK